MEDHKELFEKIMSLDLCLQKHLKEGNQILNSKHKMDFEGLLYNSFELTSDCLMRVHKVALQLGLQNSQGFINFVMDYYHKLDS